MSGRLSPDHRPAACVAPTSRGRPCPDTPLPDAPFPLCVHHLSMVWKYANERVSRARAGRPAAEQRRLPPAPDLVAAAGAARPRQPGTVYYLRIGPLIKIGVTGDLVARLKNYPPNAEVLATEPGDADLEATRLSQFEEHCVHPTRREWFRPGDDLIAHIDALAAGA